MIYDEFVKAIQTALEVPLNQEDESFTRFLPRVIEYAENRIYRETDFLAATNAITGTLTANSREIVLPSSIVVLRGINVFTPVGAITNTSVRYTLDRVSLEALDMFWPQSSLPAGASVPKQYALIGTAAVGPPQALGFMVRLGPEPDVAYPVEFTGVIRPAKLSATNTQTYLSMVYPDLFFAACMIMGAGYQRDFGAQADDPAKAMSWEGIYKELLAGATLEGARQRGEGPGWTSQPPVPVANQPRAP